MKVCLLVSLSPGLLVFCKPAASVPCLVPFIIGAGPLDQ